MRGLTIAFASSALVLCGTASASATELQFSLSNAQGTFEAFDLDSANGMYDSFGGYIYFDTTNDTAGNNGAFFGDASTSGNFGTGTLNTADNPGYGSVVTAFSDYVAVPFYGDSGTTLEAAPGEVIPTSFGNTVTISAVSAAPEPSAWAMMLLGIGAIGLALRQAKKKHGFTFAKTLLT